MRIREITVKDVPQLYELYRDASITAFMEPLFADPEQEIAYTKDYIENVYGFYGYGMWVLEEKRSGQYSRVMRGLRGWSWALCWAWHISTKAMRMRRAAQFSHTGFKSWDSSGTVVISMKRIIHLSVCVNVWDLKSRESEAVVHSILNTFSIFLKNNIRENRSSKKSE